MNNNTTKKISKQKKFQKIPSEKKNKINDWHSSFLLLQQRYQRLHCAYQRLLIFHQDQLIQIRRDLNFTPEAMYTRLPEIRKRNFILHQ